MTVSAEPSAGTGSEDPEAAGSPGDLRATSDPAPAPGPGAAKSGPGLRLGRCSAGGGACGGRVCGGDATRGRSRGRGLTGDLEGGSEYRPERRQGDDRE